MSSKAVRILAMCCLAAGMLLVIWLCWPTSQAPILPSTKPPSPSPSAAVTQSQAVPQNNPVTKAPTPQEIQVAHETEVKREQAQVTAWIMTPITFYGKVVDERKNPVQEAKVVMSAADHPYGVGSGYERRSDAGGLFSINGIHGVGLLVKVSKEGYYSLPQSWGNFGYAIQGGDQKPPHTDPNDPAVFVLRKMGEVESLIVQNKNIKTSKTGAPLSMDLRTGKTYGLSNGDIQVQTWTQDQGTTPNGGPHYDWRYVLTVPGGGVQQRSGDGFDFTAPDTGYQPTDEVKMSASDPAWDSRVTREYFLKLASGEYARVSITMYAGGDNFFSITSYLNPTPGHRNLEYSVKQ